MVETLFIFTLYILVVKQCYRKNKHKLYCNFFIFFQLELVYSIYILFLNKLMYYILLFYGEYLS